MLLSRYVYTLKVLCGTPNADWRCNSFQAVNVERCYIIV